MMPSSSIHCPKATFHSLQLKKPPFCVSPYFVYPPICCWAAKRAPHLLYFNLQFWQVSLPDGEFQVNLLFPFPSDPLNKSFHWFHSLCCVVCQVNSNHHTGVWFSTSRPQHVLTWLLLYLFCLKFVIISESMGWNVFTSLKFLIIIFLPIPLFLSLNYICSFHFSKAAVKVFSIISLSLLCRLNI